MTESEFIGAFLELRAKNRALRSKSSEAPMLFLRAFHYNHWRGGSSKPGPGIAEQQFRGQLIAKGN
jgi:hypothetical protein